MKGDEGRKQLRKMNGSGDRRQKAEGRKRINERDRTECVRGQGRSVKRY